jgi:hypothetical protein
LVGNFGARIFKDAEAGELTGAVAYLEANPPQQQAWNGNLLSWRPRPARPNDTRSRILIDHVKTIRNNLFHGGKELRDHALAERDSALLNAGMTVLRHVISLDPEVANAFSATGTGRPVA